MRKQLVARLLGAILMIEAACMLPSLAIALIYGDPGDARALLQSILPTLAVGLALRLIPKPESQNLRAKDGFAVVSLSWILLSIFGSLPFVFSKLLPGFVDALFESVSGFTTTGASVLTNFDRPLHGVMAWRSFTHWIGGMGVLVLTLALLPKLTGRTAHLVKAESPGPGLSKILPKMGDSAKVLYLIYGALTLLEFIALLCCGLNPYDAMIHSLSNAGTGGFSNYSTSIATFQNPAVSIVVTVFMFLFGLNFALFYQLLIGNWRGALKSEEMRWYAGITLVSIVLFTVMVRPLYQSLGDTIRNAAFTTTTILSTTGFSLADFDKWPVNAKMLIFLLMFLGANTGSTAGGIKTMRIALLWKQSGREIKRTYQPRRVQAIRFEGRVVEEGMLHNINVFIMVYVSLVVAGGFLLGLDNKFDLQTNLTAALTCISNVGPGLGVVGPTGNFAAYSSPSKLLMTTLMLAGRLELFPILALAQPSLWKK